MEKDVDNVEVEAPKKRDEELDQLNQIRINLDQQDVENKILEAMEAMIRSLWPTWTIDRMQEEAIKNVDICFLEPNTSFLLSNKSDRQLDFPMIAKAFLFRCFEHTMKVHMSNGSLTRSCCSFMKCGQSLNTISGA